MSSSNKAEGSNRTSGNKGKVLIKVLPQDIGSRLDHFLVTNLPTLTRSRIKNLIDENMVTVSGVKGKCALKLKGDEIIEVTFPEPEPIDALPEEIPLKIIYEDSSLIVLYKTSGMVVHPSAGHSRGTLVNALLFHCNNLSGIGGKLRPGIVHRLDKDTSGVMLVTKNDAAHINLSQQFKAHSIKRKYMALVYGRMEREGKIDLPLGRDSKNRKKIAVVEGGRRAVTHWKVLKEYKGISLVELELETGRTHQIRVHLSKLGHPVIGDPTYGSSKRVAEIPSSGARNKVLALKGQALHAFLLGFNHPVTGQYLEFTYPLPEDMMQIIEIMEKDL